MPFADLVLEREILLESGGDAASRGALRKQRAGPLIDQIYQWALAQGGLRRSDFGKAVAYVLSHWQGLRRFLDTRLSHWTTTRRNGR
jgi:hypothetical protein